MLIAPFPTVCGILMISTYYYSIINIIVIDIIIIVNFQPKYLKYNLLKYKSGVWHSKPCPVPHCTVLPPGEFSAIILEPFSKHHNDSCYGNKHCNNTEDQKRHLAGAT